ncbi:MAG: universal stress protein [Gammaproteobacteria bacterium]|jgi:universal stress protein A
MLVAVDITNDEPWVGLRASLIASNLDCAVHVLHVLEPNLPPGMSPAAAGAVINVPDLHETETERHAAAERDLAEYCVRTKLDAAHFTLRTGIITQEILKNAELIHADLIILGTHGRSGVARLLGSNASAVVHQAHCDVLTVRLPLER